MENIKEIHKKCYAIFKKTNDISQQEPQYNFLNLFQHNNSKPFNNKINPEIENEQKSIIKKFSEDVKSLKDSINSKNIHDIKREHTPNIMSSKENEDNNMKFLIKCLFHEIRNPLNNIVLGVDYLYNDEEDNEKKNILEIIKKSSNFLNVTLNGFLLIKNNKIDVNELKLEYSPFNIIGLFKKLEYLLYFNMIEKNIKIIYNIKPLICNWVIGDSSKLEQAFLNLLLNAIKYSKLGKDSFQNNESTPIIIEISNTINNVIQINIIDNNENIPESIKKNLFQKFITTEGTGLGLYLTKKIIELHNGKINHEYIVPNGNKFIVLLNLEYCNSSNINSMKIEQGKQDYPPPNSLLLRKQDFTTMKIVEENNLTPNITFVSEPESSTIIKKINNPNILIVDDSELTRKLLIKLIKKNIPSSLIMESIDGLESLKVIHEKINDINIIFMDNIMPNITGPLATKIIRKLGYKNLIIGITGNGSKDDIDDFINPGCDYVFIKPFSNDILLKLINFIDKYGYKSYEDHKLNFLNDKLIWSKN
jgi:nitrogen-specific signal transduction histidine kinase/CheY-like chemotaxis protein